ncbi:hypothetical protein [Planctomicrobium piriforme]|uniref:Uncharacterized protein n=1 Tax=Planctomicrobium piriforme TaxID=1576369 RepID=A0A1I3IEB9_9PLAN|nr:hypothetical protein [Planctomicrobium piriforme]SFI46209.1 hypothetical protein SAMN05421753_10983 [Planctomicrobium piriforme]
MGKAFLICLVATSFAVAAGPTQSSVQTVLGPKAFHDGDVIEITDVKATSPRLEQGDSVTVQGRFRLESRPAADLSLYLTQTKGDGSEETDSRQILRVNRGSGEFELKLTIKHQGVLHLTYYDAVSGKPVGGVYFGTPKQMEQCAGWDVSYYVSAPPK